MTAAEARQNAADAPRDDVRALWLEIAVKLEASGDAGANPAKLAQDATLKRGVPVGENPYDNAFMGMFDRD